MNFLGIYREPEFSPGRHVANDAKILRLVGQTLERLGVTVRLATLEEARPQRHDADLIFSMCQGPKAVSELIGWKKSGALILNDPEASRRTYRDSLCSALREKDLGFPHSEFISTIAHPRELDQYHPWFENNAGAWLKRADVHATLPTDVLKLERWSDLNSALVKFRSRGLDKAVLQQHRVGDEVKFYGVKGRFFWPYHPKESEGHPFDDKELKRMAEHAAASLDVSIYGGDAIISPDGEITLIDLNDWPSFAPCRGAAANAIARYLKDTYRAIQNPRATAKV